MAEQTHIDEALAVFGLVADAPLVAAAQPFYLWPENVSAFNVFQTLRTQWRISMAGPTGLDYTAVISHLRDGLHLSRRKFTEMYAAVRVMESGWLEGLQERLK